MTKALGKEPPTCHHNKPCLACATIECQDHYRQALLETADELECLVNPKNECDCGLCKLMNQRRISALIKQLRISAGECDSE